MNERGSRVRLPAAAGNFSVLGFDSRGWGGGCEFFSSPSRPEWLCGPPAFYPVGTRGSFLGVKRPGREADHSPPSSTEVKNAWSYTSAPQHAFDMELSEA
jgi:hypothetical protein